MHCNLRVISPGERENALPFTQQQNHRESKRDREWERGRGTMHWHLLTGKVSFILMCSTLTTCKWLPVCGAFQLCRFSFGFSFRKIACRCKCSVYVSCVCVRVCRMCAVIIKLTVPPAVALFIQFQWVGNNKNSTSCSSRGSGSGCVGSITMPILMVITMRP